MSHTNLKKCLLSLQINERDKIKYTVYPSADVVNIVDDVETYEYTVDVNNPFKITINVTGREGLQSSVIVKHFVVDDIKVSLNNISVYKTKNNKIKNTHGYLDEEGTYQLKLHTNPISQNYLDFILGLTNN